MGQAAVEYSDAIEYIERTAIEYILGIKNIFLTFSFHSKIKNDLALNLVLRINLDCCIKIDPLNFFLDELHRILDKFAERSIFSIMEQNLYLRGP